MCFPACVFYSQSCLCSVGTAPAAQGVTGKRADDDDDDVPPPVAPRTGPIMPEFTSNCPVSPEGLLYIKLEPDERGRFGFNVKVVLS